MLQLGPAACWCHVEPKLSAHGVSLPPTNPSWLLPPALHTLQGCRKQQGWVSARRAQCHLGLKKKKKTNQKHFLSCFLSKVGALPAV